MAKSEAFESLTELLPRIIRPEPPNPTRVPEATWVVSMQKNVLYQMSFDNFCVLHYVSAPSR